MRSPEIGVEVVSPHRCVVPGHCGRRDLFVAQGHVLETIEKTNPYLKYKQTDAVVNA